MHQVLEPFEQARDDYAILTGLAERLGFAERFTEGRTPREWIEHLWKVTVQRAAEAEIDLPDFQTFWHGGVFRTDPDKVPARTFTLERFRADPEGAPLATPSGKVEIFSKRIASFNLADCKGHPMWFGKEEFIGSARSARFPLALNSNQPVTRLHTSAGRYTYSKRRASALALTLSDPEKFAQAQQYPVDKIPNLKSSRA